MTLHITYYYYTVCILSAVSRYLISREMKNKEKYGKITRFVNSRNPRFENYLPTILQISLCKHPLITSRDVNGSAEKQFLKKCDAFFARTEFCMRNFCSHPPSAQMCIHLKTHYVITSQLQNETSMKALKSQS